MYLQIYIYFTVQHLSIIDVAIYQASVLKHAVPVHECPKLHRPCLPHASLGSLSTPCCGSLHLSHAHHNITIQIRARPFCILHPIFEFLNLINVNIQYSDWYLTLTFAKHSALQHKSHVIPFTHGYVCVYFYTSYTAGSALTDNISLATIRKWLQYRTMYQIRNFNIHQVTIQLYFLLFH